MNLDSAIRQTQIYNIIVAVKRAIKNEKYHLRCYQKPVEVNGWPFGYARTFKIVTVKNEPNTGK